MPSIIFFLNKPPYRNWQKLEFFSNQKPYKYKGWLIKYNEKIAIVEPAFFEKIKQLKPNDFIIDALGVPTIGNYNNANLTFKFPDLATEKFRNEISLNFYVPHVLEEGEYTSPSQTFERILDNNIRISFSYFSNNIVKIINDLRELNYTTCGKGEYKDWQINSARARQSFPDFLGHLDKMSSNYNWEIEHNDID